jgi:hypothetical protein
MTSPPPTVLEHMGPYIGHASFETLTDLSKQAYRAYSELTTAREIPNINPERHLVIGLMHIAEVTALPSD